MLKKELVKLLKSEIVHYCYHCDRVLKYKEIEDDFAVFYCRKCDSEFLFSVNLEEE